MAFILNVLLDLPCEQVASVIDKSENATRILIHRAKQNIKDFLCNNCSLYDSKNTCHCENLINFSLKQNWISMDNPSNISAIETEIKNLKDVVCLYKTIQESQLTDEPGMQIKQLLAQNDNMQILNSKKVK